MPGHTCVPESTVPVSGLICVAEEKLCWLCWALAGACIPCTLLLCVLLLAGWHCCVHCGCAYTRGERWLCLVACCVSAESIKLGYVSVLSVSMDCMGRPCWGCVDGVEPVSEPSLSPSPPLLF